MTSNDEVFKFSDAMSSAVFSSTYRLGGAAGGSVVPRGTAIDRLHLKT